MKEHYPTFCKILPALKKDKFLRSDDVKGQFHWLVEASALGRLLGEQGRIVPDVEKFFIQKNGKPMGFTTLKQGKDNKKRTPDHWEHIVIMIKDVT